MVRVAASSEFGSAMPTPPHRLPIGVAGRRLRRSRYGSAGRSRSPANGYCAGVFSYPGAQQSASPLPYVSPDPNYGLIIAGSAYNLSSPSPGNGNPACTVTATDNSNQQRQANLQVYYDSSTLTIQSNARRTK